MRKIPIKNYVILAIIFIATIFVACYIKKVYENKELYENKTNERVNILYELKEDDLKSYLIENRDMMIYMSSAKNKTIETFELEFKNYIIENELTKEIVYLNLDNVSSEFLKTFKDKYMNSNLKDVELYNQSNLIFMEDGKAIDVLYEKNQTINMEDVKTFMSNNMVTAK